MKHAFLIMAHGSLPLLRVLLSMLDDERNDIFLHIDRKSDMLDGAEPLVLSKARLFVLEQRVDVRWGNLSQIKAEYVLFEEALKHGPYAYYHLLSGQDLPIKSQDYIHQFFEEHQGKEFVGINHGEEFEWDCRRKMMRYWLFTSLTRSKYGALNAITRRLNKYLSMLLMPFLHRQKMDFAKGANWVSITQACVEYVVSKKPFVLKRFNYTFCLMSSSCRPWYGISLPLEPPCILKKMNMRAACDSLTGNGAIHTSGLWQTKRSWNTATASLPVSLIWSMRISSAGSRLLANIYPSM